MFVWEQHGKDSTACTKHDTVFPRGHVCPICTTVDADFVDGAGEVPDNGKRDGCPTAEDHERWMVALSNSLLKRAKRKKMQVADICKLVDLAIKCRRNALGLAVRREDWAETKRLESEMRKLASSRETARSVS